MKYLFVSDIHGNVENLEKCFQILAMENANKLILLGDTAASYSEGDNFLLAEILNENKEKVEVIRGNCDTSDFEDLLKMEMFDDDILWLGGKLISIEHGHIHNFYHLPHHCGDIFIQGHTHVPQLIVQGGRILANPGSVTCPRGTDLRCYLLVDENAIFLKLFDTNHPQIIKKVDINIENISES